MDNATLRQFEVDLRHYRLLAVQKTVHRYSGNFRVRIEQIDGHRLRVFFEPKAHVSVSSGPRLSDFETELLDQELREAIGAETRAVRNLILAQAFSATNLLDPIGETADPQQDPLGISRADWKG